ncbi:MAG: hypothetical protein H6835_03465 [Planctomycetes bacterium]|nr:hypothetical protein [Planctomycetota bacterium]
MKKMSRAVVMAIALLGSAAAQQQRVMVGTTPSNLRADWAQVVALPDPLQADAFLVVMPLSAVSSFVVFDSDMRMDWLFGSGSWSRCHMTATEWAYLSPDACAHQPGALGLGPLSLLTTDYDYGGYYGQQGQPLFADATWFPAAGASALSGLPGYYDERWQLRVRGWSGNAWNGCTPASLTPQFSGWLGVRFVVSFS